MSPSSFRFVYGIWHRQRAYGKRRPATDSDCPRIPNQNLLPLSQKHISPISIYKKYKDIKREKDIKRDIKRNIKREIKGKDKERDKERDKGER